MRPATSSVADCGRDFDSLRTIDAERTVPVGTAMGSHSIWPEIAGYEIQSIIGRGGMGLVYLAVDLRLNRRVAIKMLRHGVEPASELRRFETEAAAIARLQHPNIVQIHGYGESGGQPYLCLEFVDGGNLASRIASQPIPFREAASIGAKLADAVGLAHRHGIIHRDLKPANVLLTSGGEPKITDFGLAKQIDVDSNLTQSGALIGTPRYMSPEQASGETSMLTPASDVFSLGAILYEMLTGTTPFRGETVFDLLSQVRHAEPVRPRRFNSKLPSDLETICLRALEKSPHRRYRDAIELRDELDRYVRGEPIRARAVGPIERSVKWIRRRPALAGAIAGGSLAGVLAIGLVVSNFYAMRLRSAYEEAADQRDRAETFRIEAETQRALARRHLYFADMNHAYRAFREGQSRRMAELIERHASQPELHGFEWRLLERLRTAGWHELTRLGSQAVFGGIDAAGRRVAVAGLDGAVEIWDLATERRLATAKLPKQTFCAAIDPSGRQVAIAEFDGLIRILDAANAAERFTLANESRAMAMCFSPDGRSLAVFGWHNKVSLWNLETRSVRQVMSVAFGDGIQYSLDGARLLIASRDRKLRLVDGATARPIREFATSERSLTGATFFDGDRRVASRTFDNRLWMWNVADGAVLCSLNEMESNGCIAGQRNGPLLATGSYGGAIRLWDANGQFVKLLGAMEAKVSSMAFTPDGKELLSAAFDGSIRRWNLAEASERREFAGKSHSIRDVRFFRSDDRLACGGVDSKGTALSVWDSTTGKELLRVNNAIARLEAFQLAVSPDGKLLAAGGFDCHARTFDSTTGEQVASYLRHTSDVTRIAFQPDGSRLATGSGDFTVKVWDRKSARELATLKKHGIWVKALAYSTGGEVLASGCMKGEICLWNARTFELAWSGNSGHGEVLAIAFAPDASRFISVGSDGAKVWEFDPTLATLPREVLRLAGHSGPILAVAYTPQGDRVATTGWDRTVRVWDTRTGQEVLTLTGLNNPGVAVDFSFDGARLAAADGGRSVMVWSAK